MVCMDDTVYIVVLIVLCLALDAFRSHDLHEASGMGVDVLMVSKI